MIPHAYPSKKPCMGVAGNSFTSPLNCRVSGRRARSSAIRRGARAIQLRTYKLGSGKITTCRTAERIASSHALLSILNIAEAGYQGKSVEEEFFKFICLSTNSTILSVTKFGG